MVCSLTHKCFGASMVYAEERDRDGEGRDGGMTYTSAKNGGRGGYGPRSVFSRKKNNVSKSAQERMNASMEDRHNRWSSNAAFKRVLGQDSIHLETHLTEIYPRIKYPTPSRQGRSLISEICSLLIYDREVRKVIWDRTRSEELEIQNA
jgi:hypothetical protein